MTVRMAVIAALWLALAGCYETPKPACSFSCVDNNGACPEGYRCADDGWCKRDDVAADLDCGDNLRIDAAPPVDAPVDAPPVDAPPVDAPPVDAPPVDASMVFGRGSRAADYAVATLSASTHSTIGLATDPTATTRGATPQSP
ncbi:MAG: hypothetical protein MJE77_22355 [Proteobacteria bacterium]|nr:hypothetical protein [Pseudomonadota bacterium]